MGLLDQLTKARQSVLGALDRAAPPPLATLPLSERLGLRGMSDEEMRRELERRRRARRRPAHGRPAGVELDAVAKARRDRMRERSVAKCYALLELPAGAPLGDVEAAYRKLLRQFHPDRFAGDPERHASAIALVTSLTDAYLALRNGRG